MRAVKIIPFAFASLIPFIVLAAPVTNSVPTVAGGPINLTGVSQANSVYEQNGQLIFGVDVLPINVDALATLDTPKIGEFCSLFSFDWMLGHLPIFLHYFETQKRLQIIYGAVSNHYDYQPAHHALDGADIALLATALLFGVALSYRRRYTKRVEKLNLELNLERETSVPVSRSLLLGDYLATYDINELFAIHPNTKYDDYPDLPSDHQWNYNQIVFDKGGTVHFYLHTYRIGVGQYAKKLGDYYADVAEEVI